MMGSIVIKDYLGLVLDTDQYGRMWPRQFYDKTFPNRLPSIFPSSPCF